MFSIQVEDDSEVKSLKADTDYADEVSNSKMSRTEALEERHKKKQSHTKADQKENKYSRKLDYRCEGSSY